MRRERIARPDWRKCGARFGERCAYLNAQLQRAAYEPAPLHPIPIDSESFAPFGQVIAPGEDGTPFGPGDAQLVLSNGTPRLYIMRLRSRGLAFDRITRHVRVTQCLAVMGEREWLLAVAPPLSTDDLSAMPDPATIKAFRVSEPIGIKLHRGTWHAGPFFDAPTMFQRASEARLRE
jgi:ureidoglycolate lyase